MLTFSCKQKTNATIAYASLWSEEPYYGFQKHFKVSWLTSCVLLYKAKIVLMVVNNELVNAYDPAIFSIILHSAKLLNLKFGLRPKIGPQIKLWSHLWSPQKTEPKAK